MKKIFKLFLILTLATVLTACGKDGKPDQSLAPDNGQPSKAADDQKEETELETTSEEGQDLSGVINFTGFTSVEKIIMDMKSDFEAYNPDVTVNYTGTGSSAGIEDAVNERNDLGASSREVKEEELAEGITSTVFAYDGIAVIVNPGNEIEDLSVEQVMKIYSGEITNWKEVGGKDGKINVVSREGASGTRSAFEELTGLSDHETGLRQDATVVEGNGTAQTTVAGDENAIAYVSFSFIDDTVKALTIEGATANADEIKANKYPLSRPFLFAYKKENLTPQAQAFLDYAISSQGQAFVETHGGIRVD